MLNRNNLGCSSDKHGVSYDNDFSTLQYLYVLHTLLILILDFCVSFLAFYKHHRRNVYHDSVYLALHNHNTLYAYNECIMDVHFIYANLIPSIYRVVVQMVKLAYARHINHTNWYDVLYRNAPPNF